MFTRVVSIVVLLIFGLGAAGYVYIRDVAAVAGGYVSQTLCTNVVMLGRDQSAVEAQDLSFEQQRLSRSDVEGRVVNTTVSLGPLQFLHKSMYRPGLGCSQIADWELERAGAVALAANPAVTPAATVNSSTRQEVVTVQGLNQEQLTSAVNKAFVEAESSVYDRKNTRAVLVHYKGKLVAERYAPGFDRNTPLRGMSMTKSVSATLVGVLAQRGKLDIYQPAPVRGWSDLGDGRSRVTTHHLLKMIAGFDYVEEMESDPRNRLNRMLYAVADAGAFAVQTPLRSEPGTSWSYQTVHSVLLHEVIRNTIADDQTYFSFPNEALFDRLGMRHSFFQTDVTGTFIGGASMYASGRDWMKLGLLYLNDGVAIDEQGSSQRILPEWWVDYATQPSEASSKERAYGAQIWLNTASPQRLFPEAPEDTYAFQGHYGQYVIVIPSLELVVVRLGMTFAEGGKAFDKQEFLQDIIAALPRA